MRAAPFCVLLVLGAGSANATDPAAPSVWGTIAPPWAAPLTSETAPPDAASEQCLASAVYYEAATEPRAGQEAVAQVVLNRLRSPLFPKTICGVVYQGSHRRTGCQFTFTCDGSLTRTPVPRLWKQARDVADQALHGFAASGLTQALNYHADYVAPAWRNGLVRVTQIGAHIFYRPRAAGEPASTFAARTTPTTSASSTPARHGAASTSFSVWGIDVATVGRGGAVTSTVPIAVTPNLPFDDLTTLLRHDAG